MFTNKTIYVIHQENQPCGLTSSASTSEQKVSKKVMDFVRSMYPKQKFLSLVFESILQLNLIDDKMYFIGHPHVHVADFCSFINNRFGKNDDIPVKFIKLCKHLQSQGIRFPKVSIKNPVAQKYLC